jgi:hypothetical protein
MALEARREKYANQGMASGIDVFSKVVMFEL